MALLPDGDTRSSDVDETPQRAQSETQLAAVSTQLTENNVSQPRGK